MDLKQLNWEIVLKYFLLERARGYVLVQTVMKDVSTRTRLENAPNDYMQVSGARVG